MSAEPLTSDDVAARPTGVRVALFATCASDVMFPGTPKAVVTLLERLGCEVGVVECVRRAMQRFEPTGMFCADLRECLTVQLQEAGRCDPFMERLLDNLPMLARRDHRQYGRAHGAARRFHRAGPAISRRRHADAARNACPLSRLVAEKNAAALDNGARRRQRGVGFEEKMRQMQREPQHDRHSIAADVARRDTACARTADRAA